MERIHRATMGGTTSCGLPGKISTSGVGVSCAQCVMAQTFGRETAENIMAALRSAATHAPGSEIHRDLANRALESLAKGGLR